jgi:CRISPR-associated endonuclease Csn1
MTQVNKPYILGLDIGTNSCGYAASDLKNRLLHLNGKTAIGALLFEAGKSAAERRSFRTTRRRLSRRKWRLGLLEEIFDPYMAEVDPYFFARLKQSGLSPKDSRKKAQAIVFPTPAEDKAFYDDYPTIYHLRNALMTQDRKFDLREVYLAIHHIVKYRGNFLQDTPVRMFDASEIDVKKTLSELNDLFDQQSEENKIHFNLDNADEVEKILLDHNKFKKDKQKEIAKLITYSVTGKENKSLNKLNRDVAKQIANAILGYKTNFETIFDIEINSDDKNSWEFKLSDADADEKLIKLDGLLDQTQQDILSKIQGFFSAVTLTDLVDPGKTLSATMVRKYNDHAKHYALLKKVVAGQTDPVKAKNLCLAYDLYVNNRHGRLLQAKKAFSKKRKDNGKGTLPKDEFYKLISQNLDESSDAKQISDLIDKDEFMPKQRTNQNGVIPNQLHQVELNIIIENQSKFYPFLATPNPVKKHINQAPYKLDELVRFRVPYYVGPLIEKTDGDLSKQAQANQTFAWMVRNEQGRITPWNFEKKVDKMKSANRFIKRMTTKDTYLLAEDVLPANSLLYQRYEVLNELNNIRVNGKKLAPEQKQTIYQDWFMKNKTVTAENLCTFLKTNYNLLNVEIKGLADPKKFNSSLSTYYQLKKIAGLKDKLLDLKYRTDLENIIEWSTIFEDREIFEDKLKTVSWLADDEKTIKQLSKLRYQGWGKLSRKLLVGLHDRNGQNIIGKMWDSQSNFMQIIHEPDFQAAIIKENQKFTRSNDLEDILADAYTSPANKKAIRQVVKVVDDVVKAAGHRAPKQIAIEFARDAEDDPQITRVRGSHLRQAYKDAADDIVADQVKNDLDAYIKDRKLARYKYYLYFMQGGRDAYSGQKINLDEVTKYYQIDHILPQSFIKDDSLTNRVLVKTPLNAEKSDDVPYKHYANKKVPGEGFTIGQMWQKWFESGLISKAKYRNLTLNTDHLNKYQKSGFVNRQLVETSQIIKLVATILQAKYPDTEIISVKASYNHAIRENPLYNLYKSRAVNDYHHAIDAYLSTVCANFLYQAYPKLRPFFVYGQYQKLEKDPEIKNETIQNLRRFNFIWPLLKTDAPNEIRSKDSNKIIFDRKKDIIEPLKRAYNFKYMNISRETTTRENAMFKMTVYPVTARDTKKRSNLIPKKKNLPVEIYGGYTGNNDAYMTIVKLNKKTGCEYRVVGVPMRALAELKTAKNQEDYLNILHKFLSTELLYNASGKPTAVKSFDIVKGKVPYSQLIIDGDRKFMLGSAAYIYNAKQLVLSEKSMKIITNSFSHKERIEQTEQTVSDNYLSVYDELLNKIDQYLPLFDINKFREKLHKGRDAFAKLSNSEKYIDLQAILNGLHDNLDIEKIANIGLSTPLGQMQYANGIVLSNNAKLIYKSPSGLFEKRVKLSDL